MSLGFDTDELYESRLSRETSKKRKLRKKLFKGNQALQKFAKGVSSSLKKLVKRPGTAGTSRDPQSLGNASRAVVPIVYIAREDSAVLGSIDRHEQIESNIDIEDPDTMPDELKESRRFSNVIHRFLEQRHIQAKKNVQGLPIKIEKRDWDQPPRDPRPYGYIDKTKGVDGDNLDVFLGHNLDSDKVFVIHSLDKNTRKFDEDKVMLGFDTGKEAKACFIDHYKKPEMYGGMDFFTIDRFRTVAAKTQKHPKRLVASRESYGFSMKSLVHDSKPNSGAQSRIFEGGPGSGPQGKSAADTMSDHAKKVPKKVWIEKAGGTYNGAMDHPKGGQLHYFRDPKTGTSLVMHDKNINSEHDVLDHMRKSRAAFARGSK